MLETDADILLIDEVLAVGDAAFQQKCADAFREMKAAGKTIVLVTHQMATVEEYCDRAMLIEGGHILQLGDPTAIGREYLRLNFLAEGQDAGAAVGAVPEGVRLLDIWLEDADGERVAGVGHGEPIRLRTEIELAREASGIAVGFTVDNADGVTMFQLGSGIGRGDGSRDIAAGERVRLEAVVENPLAPGRYFIHCGVQQDQGKGDVSLYEHNALDFVVFGSERDRGVLQLASEVEVRIEEAGPR
jgi:hypothetical protein